MNLLQISLLVLGCFSTFMQCCLLQLEEVGDTKTFLLRLLNEVLSGEFLLLLGLGIFKGLAETKAITRMIVEIIRILVFIFTEIVCSLSDLSFYCNHTIDSQFS